MNTSDQISNKSHLDKIDGESTIDRKKRLNKLRQQKYRAAQKLKDPDAAKAKATADKSKQRTSKRLTEISQGTSKALESTDMKTLKSSIELLNGLLEKNDPKDLPKIEKILIEAPDLVKLIKGHKNCDDLIKQINKREAEVKKNNPKANTPSEDTVIANIGKVKNIYKQFTKKKSFDCKDFSWVRDTDKLMKFFEDNPNWTTDKSENSNRTALASVLRGLDGYQKEYKIISDLSSDIANNKIAKQIGENKLSKSQLKNYLPWDKLVEKTQAAIKRKQTPLKDKALMALYTLRPPRRNDYAELKVIRTKSNKVTAKTIANLDKKFNYMILDKSDKPKELRFSRYKTEKKYGTQIFDVKNKELIDLLTHYIKDEKILNGDYLFVNSKEEPYKKTWSGFVSGVFKKYTGKNIGANVLRHSFISDFLSSKKPPTLNKRAIAAYEMGHSISVQATYQFLPDDDDIIPMGDNEKDIEKMNKILDKMIK
jgi:hypothetical protein